MRPNGSWRRFVCGCVLWMAASTAPAQVCDPSTCNPLCFIRGDANVNGVLDLGDAVHLLSYLFLGGSAGTCPDTFETNDDCSTSLSDGIFLLGYLFLGGDPPVSGCPSTLGCSAYPPEFCAGGHFRQAEPDARFEFSGTRILEGAALQTIAFESSVEIRVLSPALEITGWSLSLVAEPGSRCMLTGATTAGTVVDALFDGGFKKTELAPFAGGSGALSAVILSFTNPVTLPLSEGPHSVLALDFSGDIPADGCAPCQLRFLDGLQGIGQPVRNEIVVGGSTFRPQLMPAEISLCGTIAPLSLDDVSPSTIPLTEASPSRLYVLTPRPAPGKAVVLDFVSSDPGAENALYLRFGAIPTPQLFDAASDQRGDANVRLVAPHAPDQECYVLFQARRLNDSTHDLTGRATTAELSVERMAPDCASGCAGPIAVDILGGGFKPGVSFRLVGAGGVEVPASGVEVLGEDHAQATFDLTGKPAGAYRLVATRGGLEATLEAPVRVKTRETGPTLSVEFLSSPFFRAGRPKRVTIRYRNTGDEGMPAPLLGVEGPEGAELRLATEDPLPECLPHDQRNKLQCLGSPLDGPPGWLAPGAYGEIAVVVRHAAPGAILELRVDQLAGAMETALDWAEVPAPLCASQEEWESARLAFAQRLGTTWAGYRDSLGDIARQLSSRGRRTASVRELLRFVIDEALGLPSRTITGIVRDERGAPLVERVVAATSPGNGTIVVCGRTDREGAFALAPIAPGSYQLAVDLLESTPAPVNVETGRDVHGIELTTGSTAGAKLECPAPGNARLPVTPPTVPPELLVEVARLDLKVVQSIDPNDKEGPGEDLIRRGTDLVYTIHFQNDPQATAAAELVRITDVLDPNLDLSTVRFLDIQFGDELIALDTAGALGLTSGYSRSPSLNRAAALATRPVSIPYPDAERPTPLEFTGKADITVATRTLTWILSSQTRLTVEPWLENETDARAGFLPPYIALTGQGAGSVSFSVRLMSNAPSGADVPNTATIQFDLPGPEIKTRQISNRVEPCGSIPFRRGDTNRQGDEIDISDAIHVLSYLFLGIGELGCKRASDAQNDGEIDLSDAVYILQFLFSGGEPIPPPNSCGDSEWIDPSPFDCCEYESCR